jgi:hypothetical protein
LKTPQDISIAFVPSDYAEDIYDGQCTEWPVKASTSFSMSVENVYLCTHGDTPYIDTTGNWFISGKDTGVKAQGPKGDKGDKGDTGDSIYVLKTLDIQTLITYFDEEQVGKDPLTEMLNWVDNGCKENQGMSEALSRFIDTVLSAHHRAFIYGGYLFTFSYDDDRV